MATTQMTASAAECKILDVANRVAREHCLSKWSTWHSWDHYRQSTTTQRATEALEKRECRASSTAPYGSCVDLTFAIARALRSRFSTDPELRPYEDSIKTLARTSSTNLNRLVHCLTAIFLDDFCIVIDLSFTFEAVRIDLNSHADSLPCVAPDGNISRSRTRLTYIATGGNVPLVRRALIWEPLLRPEIMRTFRDMEEYQAVRDISILMASDMEDFGGRKVPRGKGVKLQASLDQKPVALPSVLVAGRYIATVCRLRINFGRRHVIVQVPYHDWLLREENRNFLTELQQRRLLPPENQAMTNIVVDIAHLSIENSVNDDIEVVSRILESLGMPKIDFLSIVSSVQAI